MNKDGKRKVQSSENDACAKLRSYPISPFYTRTFHVACRPKTPDLRGFSIFQTISILVHIARYSGVPFSATPHLDPHQTLNSSLFSSSKNMYSEQHRCVALPLATLLSSDDGDYDGIVHHAVVSNQTNAVTVITDGEHRGSLPDRCWRQERNSPTWLFDFATAKTLLHLSPGAVCFESLITSLCSSRLSFDHIFKGTALSSVTHFPQKLDSLVSCYTLADLHAKNRIADGRSTVQCLSMSLRYKKEYVLLTKTR